MGSASQAGTTLAATSLTLRSALQATRFTLIMRLCLTHTEHAIARAKPSAIDQPPCRAKIYRHSIVRGDRVAQPDRRDCGPNNLGRDYLVVPRLLPVIKRIRALVIRGFVLMKHALTLTVERVGDRHVLRQIIPSPFTAGTGVESRQDANDFKRLREEDAGRQALAQDLQLLV